jgi:8-oxo-dGTP pyrophosphatase MutT (NUDIX family)
MPALTPNRTLYRAVSRSLLHPWFRLRRGMTLGVRALVVDGGSVLLVRHSYAPGWLLPGGGVERGETVFDALKRELEEEAGVVVGEGPVLHGLFANEQNFRGDHVACFVVRNFEPIARARSLEIAEARIFPVRALPEQTTGGTRRRIAEVFDGAAVSAHW